MKRQKPGKIWTFPCGCTDYLPKKRGESNRFVIFGSPKNGCWHCRISVILCANRKAARKMNYKSPSMQTPHSKIRKMMDDPCERCGQPLTWEFGLGKTPHLHHSHYTGEIYGFTHPHCNPRAMELEIDRLKKEIKELRSALDAQMFEVHS